MNITDPMVLYLIQTFKKMFVPAEKGKGLSTNDFTDEYKAKVDGFTSGGGGSSEKYAVGDIFITTRNGNPSSLLGYGTWEQIKDSFLLAAGDTYAQGDTGGEATHTLTEDELPEVSGTVDFRPWTTGAPYTNAQGSFSSLGEQSSTAVGFASSGTSDGYRRLKYSFGGGQAHNNMPPFLAVNMWIRTA